MKTYELIFGDGTTQPIKADTIQDAWITGKIVAAERKTYLSYIREKT